MIYIFITFLFAFHFLSLYCSFYYEEKRYVLILMNLLKTNSEIKMFVLRNKAFDICGTASTKQFYLFSGDNIRVDCHIWEFNSEKDIECRKLLIDKINNNQVNFGLNFKVGENLLLRAISNDKKIFNLQLFKRLVG